MSLNHTDILGGSFFTLARLSPCSLPTTKVHLLSTSQKTTVLPNPIFALQASSHSTLTASNWAIKISLWSTLIRGLLYHTLAGILVAPWLNYCIWFSLGMQCSFFLFVSLPCWLFLVPRFLSKYHFYFWEYFPSHPIQCEALFYDFVLPYSQHPDNRCPVFIDLQIFFNVYMKIIYFITS